MEDDFILRAHLAELLMMEGYQVTCAGDGAEALSKLLHEPPFAVIVLDLELPRVDGFSFRAVQLQSPALREIPTIAFTSVRDPAKLPRFDFAAVIPKGTAFEPLMSTLAAFCPPSVTAA